MGFTGLVSSAFLLSSFLDGEAFLAFSFSFFHVLRLLLSFLLHLKMYLASRFLLFYLLLLFLFLFYSHISRLVGLRNGGRDIQIAFITFIFEILF